MQQYGCISEPEIKRFRVRSNDYAILLGSDGFWDHDGLKLKNILQAVAKQKHRSARELCTQLLTMAKLHGDPKDDCTIACLTLN